MDGRLPGVALVALSLLIPGWTGSGGARTEVRVDRVETRPDGDGMTIRIVARDARRDGARDVRRVVRRRMVADDGRARVRLELRRLRRELSEVRLRMDAGDIL